MFSAEIKKRRLPAVRWVEMVAVISLTVILPGLMSPGAEAEQMDVKVELFTELLPSEKQQKLENLGREIEEYFRDHEWIEDFSEPLIPFYFRMYLTDESVSFEDRYGARIHASNNIDLQYLDKNCHFAYQPDKSLEHDAIFYNSLTGLLDFYAYLIIGGEMDKRSTLGGNPYFKQAREVIQKALFSEYYAGWNRRSEELDAILADENVPFRKMLAVYFRALAYWKNEMVEDARQYCRYALAMIDGILRPKEGDEEPSREQKEQIARFFTQHFREMADILMEDPQGQEAFELPMDIDPQHREFYEKYLAN